MLGFRRRQLRACVPDVQTELTRALAFLHQVRDRHTPCVGENAVVRTVALGQDDSGVAHICWALLRDGKLLITFDDAHLLDRRIASAAQVYGLSGMQERLARHLVEGCDLSAAAAAMDVSKNTAKTHLQRIYDKTGVHSQPALIRVLLNANRDDL